METRTLHTTKIAFVVHCSTSFPRTLETRLSSDDELWVQQLKHDLFTMQTIPSKVKKSADFNGSTINTVKQGILAAFNKMIVRYPEVFVIERFVISRFNCIATEIRSLFIYS